MFEGAVEEIIVRCRGPKMPAVLQLVMGFDSMQKFIPKTARLWREHVWSLTIAFDERHEAARRIALAYAIPQYAIIDLRTGQKTCYVVEV